MKIVNDYVSWFKRSPIGCLLCTFMTLVAVSYGSTKPPPIVPIERVEGIKITSFASDADGVRITWTTEDERITDVDTYNVEYCERQIPSISGYSGWKKLAETTSKSIVVPTYLRNRDVKVRISVLKEVDE